MYALAGHAGLLWTVLIIVLILAVLAFVFGRGRYR